MLDLTTKSTAPSVEKMGVKTKVDTGKTKSYGKSATLLKISTPPTTPQTTTDNFPKRNSLNKHAQLGSYVMQGIDAKPVTIEVSISPGITRFDIIGLGDVAIKESKERIIKAITESGFSMPVGNITANLAPAKIPKKGSLYDLPIALALLVASRQIPAISHSSAMIVAGELSLAGGVCEVDGLFATIVKTLSAKKPITFLMPLANIKDCVPFIETPTISRNSDDVYTKKHGIRFIATKSLSQAIAFLEDPAQADRHMHKTIAHYLHEQHKKGTSLCATSSPSRYIHKKENHDQQICDESIENKDFSEVLGQDTAKTALQLAAAARLNVLFVGPPGCGKSMLMRRLPSILPRLSAEDALNLTLIEHAFGMKETRLSRTAPLREAHSNIPVTSLIGGGKIPKPGEISLAHKGFLFLDEISLFSTCALQSLRTPIEEKSITINRLAGSIQYPADFALLACCNPCPCGFYGDKRKMCRCSKNATQRFFQKLSRPFVDRFDIILYITPAERKDFDADAPLGSLEMKKNVDKTAAYANTNRSIFSAQSLSEILDTHPLLKAMVTQALNQNILSLRRVKAMLKVLNALMNQRQTREYDRTMVLQAMNLSSNKLIEN